jgi:hypothetical protein
MFDDDLPTGLWVQAHLARCTAQGTPVYVVRRGDPQTGMVLLKVVVGRTARVFTRSRDMEGRLGWLPGLSGEAVPEFEADAFIERATKRDPDLWVLEVESRDGSHPFEGKVF